MSKLVDSFNRKHDYLRISLTDSCNFRCLYCMPDENMQCLPHKELMQPDEIYEIAKTFTNFNTNKIRLTGGEPLVRHDFSEIVEKLSQLPAEITLTTNGVLLHKYLKLFKDKGIKSVNISIDSLDPQVFQSLTKRNVLSRVWENILLYVEEGFHVKLNVVVMKGINDKEIVNFVELTKKLPLHVRFIEFMPFSGNQWEKDRVVTMHQMLQVIAEQESIAKLKDEVNDTAKKYMIQDAVGTFAFITTMSQPFCGGCNRMRLTADGKMKNCLFGKEEFDILGTLRKKEDILPVIQQCLFNKHKKMGGQFEDFKKVNPEDLTNRSMIKIGG